MSTLKTVENDSDVWAYLDSVTHAVRRQDAIAVTKMMQEVTGEEPKMWGDSIVGFGRYQYRRADGSQHWWMLTGVAPRKQALSVYIMPGFKPYGDLMAALGKHRHSVGCLYITRLANVDFDVLKELVERSVRDMRLRYC